MSKREWTGLIYQDGELRRAEIIQYEGEPTYMWVGGDMADDIEGPDDLSHALFFIDNEHFAAWVTGTGVAAATAQEVWFE